MFKTSESGTDQKYKFLSGMVLYLGLGFLLLGLTPSQPQANAVTSPCGEMCGEGMDCVLVGEEWQCTCVAPPPVDP
jgi:hypothetical protein